MVTKVASNCNQGYQNIWYPCSQMKDYEKFIPLDIASASGCDIQLVNGKKIIDAISSWWCKSLGHNHPEIKAALIEQLSRFEHVVMPNTQNNILNQLSQRLGSLTQQLNKVFYAGDGSCAVEVALKMCVHARLICGESHRNRFIAFKNGYHGETCGALSVSDLGLYKTPYQSILFDSEFIDHIPYVSGPTDPLWHDCTDEKWQQIEQQLSPLSANANALILEPLIQGAGGMLVYSKDFLQRLANWCKQHNIYLIYDEIMTGIGRSGKMLASDYLDQSQADFICLSKGLTSGWLPFSAVLTHQHMYDIFYDDYEVGKSFLHSHTYCGNALAAAVALSVLKIFDNENIIDYVQNVLNPYLMQCIQDISEQTGRLKNIRSLGGMIAADINTPDGSNKRYGFELYKIAVKKGALLRPLGNTLYWLPPLNINLEKIDQLTKITKAALSELTY